MDHEDLQYLPFQTLEEELLAPIKGVQLSEIEIFVCGLLLKATTEKPIRMADLIVRVNRGLSVTLSDRKVRDIIHTLRNDHAFPICSRKREPGGYWWGRSEAELEEFKNVFLAQSKNEYHTVRKMLKANYPRLAGQLRFEMGVEE